MTHAYRSPRRLPISSFTLRAVLGALAVALAALGAAREAHARASRMSEWRAVLGAEAAAAYRSGGRTGVFAWTDSVRTAALARHDRALATAALLTRAGWHVQLREYAPGAACFDTAIAMASALGDTFALCWALDGRGSAASQLHDRPGEVRVRERLRRLAHAAGLREFEGLAWFGLGGVAMLAGRYDEALRAERRAIALLPPERRERLYAWNMVADVHAARGRSDEARQTYLDALADARQRGERGPEMFLVNNLGKLEYEVKDPAAALVYFERAVELARAASDSVYGARAEVNRAATLGELGRNEEAVRAMRALIPVAERPGRAALQIQLYSNLATELDELDRAGEALGYARRAAAVARPEEIQSFWNARLALARLTRRVEGAAAAIAVLDSTKALEARQDLNRRASLLELRSELYEALGRPGEALAAAREAERLTRPESAARGAGWIAAAGRLGHVHRVQGRPDSAAVLLRRAAAEWEKRRATIDSQDAREGRGPAVAALFAELGLSILEAGPERSREQRVRDAFGAMQAFQARTLEERMHGAGLSARAVSRRVTIDSLQRRVLRPDEVLIDLVATPETTLAFVVTRASLRWHGLPGLNSLEPRARVLSRALESGLSDQATRLACEQLGAELFAPAAAELQRARSVVITGGGPLAALPFGLLVAPGGAQTLLDRVALAVAPSVNLWAFQRARARAKAAPARLLALGRSTGADGRALAGVAREVRALEGAYSGVTARVNAGDRDLSSLVGDLARFDALHLAGHSTIESSSPWRSGILLGRGNGEAAYLRASRVAGLRLPARLVVLSSCTSAAARGLPGEGLQGLASAFLCSGASVVVATLWRVGDEAAEQFTSAFYRQLAGGATVGAAVRGAQLELRNGSDSRDWAAYAVLGDGDLHVPLARRGTPATRRVAR